MKRRHVLAILFLLVGLLNLLRAGMAPVVSAALEGRPVAIPLPLLGVLYACCGVCGLVFAFLFWKGRRLNWALPLAGAYQLVLWMLHLGYRATYIRALWARDLLLAVVFLVTVALLVPPNNRNDF
ncbi:MAG: hypothetical protein K8R89_07100 [Anaerolineae bacterium]|nr:hypothetical protein [Anaerolineae bacterium]